MKILEKDGTAKMGLIRAELIKPYIWYSRDLALGSLSGIKYDYIRIFSQSW